MKKKAFESPECIVHTLSSFTVWCAVYATAPDMYWDNEEGEVVGSNSAPSRAWNPEENFNAPTTDWNNLSGWN